MHFTLVLGMRPSVIPLGTCPEVNKFCSSKKFGAYKPRTGDAHQKKRNLERMLRPMEANASPTISVRSSLSCAYQTKSTHVTRLRVPILYCFAGWAGTPTRQLVTSGPGVSLHYTRKKKAKISPRPLPPNPSSHSKRRAASITHDHQETVLCTTGASIKSRTGQTNGKKSKSESIQNLR